MKTYHRLIYGGFLVIFSIAVSRFLDSMITTLQPGGWSLVAFLIILLTIMYVSSYVTELFAMLVLGTRKEIEKAEHEKRTKEYLSKRYEK